MAQRVLNRHRAKVHRNYTVDDAARLYTVHRNTVRQWIKRGLPVVGDGRRPVLILGDDLVAFHAARRASNKRPCKPGEIYCVRCRTPQEPALGMVDCERLTATTGNLIGLCPQCNGTMYRRVSLARLASAVGNLEVTVTEAPRRIVESTNPSVNGYFKRGT